MVSMTLIWPAGSQDLNVDGLPPESANFGCKPKLGVSIPCSKDWSSLFFFFHPSLPSSLPSILYALTYMPISLPTDLEKLPLFYLSFIYLYILCELII